MKSTNSFLLILCIQYFSIFGAGGAGPGPRPMGPGPWAQTFGPMGPKYETKYENYMKLWISYLFHSYFILCLIFISYCVHIYVTLFSRLFHSMFTFISYTVLYSCIYHMLIIGISILYRADLVSNSVKQVSNPMSNIRSI